MNEKVFEIEGKYCFPIDVPADAESEEAVDSVVDRLKENCGAVDGFGRLTSRTTRVGGSLACA